MHTHDTATAFEPPLDQITEKLLALLLEQQQEVLDFIDFLSQKYTQSRKQRIFGLSKGKIWMSDDFNTSLPDEFWLEEV